MRVLSRIKRRLDTALFLDLNRDPGASVFLAGVGRSGSTWVSEIINYRNGYRYIFEPFRRDLVGICSGFRRRQYLRPDNTDPRYLDPARAVLSGRVRSPWTESFNRKFISRRRLIKDIRANLLLKWMHVNFPDTPLILLLRHPCAYANSRIKQGYIPDVNITDYLEQEALLEDFLLPLAEGLDLNLPLFDRHIHQWCVEYFVPLSQFRHGEIHVAFYENFCEQPEEEISRLFSFLGKEYDESILARLNRPSSTSRTYSAILTRKSLIDGWRGDVTSEETARAERILHSYGLDMIYTGDSMPDTGGLQAVMMKDGRDSPAGR